MKEEEPEVEEAGGNRVSVDAEMALDEVPSPRADHERGGPLAEAVVPAGGVDEGDRSGHGVAQVDLARQDVVPGGGGGVLEIGHEHVGARVEGVDDHLAIDGAGDLDATILEIGGEGADRPVGLADRAGVGEEIGADPGIEAVLPLRASGEQVENPVAKAPSELGHELRGLGRQDLLAILAQRTGDRDSR